MYKVTEDSVSSHTNVKIKLKINVCIVVMQHLENFILMLNHGGIFGFSSDYYEKVLIRIRGKKFGSGSEGKSSDPDTMEKVRIQIRWKKF